MNTKNFSKNYISLADMYLAYRKAKTEAFYDNFHPHAISFSVFESNIQENIEALHSKIISKGSNWWLDESFIGDYRYVPKSLNDSIWDDNLNVHYRSVDPIKDWRQRFKENSNKRLDVNYRLILCPTVEYQIISALWILKVGHKFEEKLDKELSFGNRLRRRKHPREDFGSFNGPLNLDTSGLFSPYFSAYKSWRKKGLDAMKDLIESGNSVTAITMDLASFYHNASPNFILRPSFLNKIGVSLSKDERKFTSLLLDSINCWYKTTPDFKDRDEGALPVGLSASKIISNVLLYELDEQVSSGIEPEYYGRYVDDIFIVFKTPDGLTTGDSILTFMSKNVECLKINREKDKQPDLRLRLNYANDSLLKFTASKQKIFSLSGEYGLDFISQISSQIRAQSSEYRMLPEVPRDSVTMADKTLLASPDASLIPDALRKADVVSVRRLGLSLLLKDIENYSQDLSSENWLDTRKEFYGLVERYLLTPKGLFDLFGYLHRVFNIMISNHDFDFANRFVDKLLECIKLVEETTTKSARNTLKVEKLKEYLYEKLFETTLKSSTHVVFDKWAQLRSLLINLSNFSSNDIKPITKPKLKEISHKLMIADLGYRSYKDYWYYSQSVDFNGIKVPRTVSVRKVLRLSLIRKFRKSTSLKQPYWPALAFPTRPLSIQEIALICPKVLDGADGSKLFRESVLGLRGAGTNQYFGVRREINDSNECTIFAPRVEKSNIYVALTNFETTNEQFELSLQRTPDRSLDRYEKINQLVNDILKATPKCNYIVFPECSLPRRWAVNISSKLARQQISLIGGIEYYGHKNSQKLVRNDCLVSLATRWPGYNSNFIFMQPKLQPSHGEGEQLRESGLKQYEPKDASEILPVYKHGDFHFGVLICSDLTNPINRVRYQGKVDCLFVLEWNPDVKTFSFLVEGTAHDIHSYVVQVNNRKYGDSRVRVPHRTDYKRDTVRVKGGMSDTFVIAEIDYMPLRKFQKKGVMTDSKSQFKPIPVGFKMSSSRR
ncbi:RNA-directed DNA polymerase [Vibrio parahaemolyticus]|uniref:RNA-directed DNA polymerase n=1 Tax=Vibrio parahaemolyticus TaxID=670 RepID=UPI003B67949E